MQFAKQPQRILIILFGAIGDVTRALPLAVRIKAAWPDSQLSWAIEPKSRSILEKHSSVDQVILFDRPKGIPAYLQMIREIRALKFDLTIDLQRHLKSGVTSWLSASPYRIGFNRKNAKEANWLFNTHYIPAVDNWTAKLNHYQLFGDVLGIPRLNPLQFGLTPDSLEVERVRNLLLTEAERQHMGGIPDAEECFACILGSSWNSRIWPIDHWIRAIEMIKDRFRLYPVLVGGPDESSIAEAIVQQSRGVVFNLVGRTTLRELVSVFSLVAFGVGSDSGPMHICSAVGRPVISLWGSTSPSRSAPFGSEHLVLQSPIGCAPCYERECPGLGRLCMSSIPPEAVVARITAGFERP